MTTPAAPNTDPAISAHTPGGRPHSTTGRRPITAKPAPTIRPNERSCRVLTAVRLSVKGELLPPVRIVRKRRLAILVENAVLEHQNVHFRPHETTIRVFRRADDRLAAHVERGVDQHRASGALLEFLEQGVVPRVGLMMDGVYSC